MNVYNLQALISLNTDDYDKKVNKIQKDPGKISKSLSKIGGAGKALAKGLGITVAAGAAGVTAIGASSVKAGMQFDASMSQVAATMGTTIDQIQNLRDFAQEMGRTTAFSASQSADALNYMALAGYDAEKSMKMLPNVLDLAAAGGMDLARASDMVTDISSSLGLSEKQTTGLVDQMAKASSKSNTSVEQLGDAMLRVGGTAKIMAGGTTEISTALGILADNGTKGAEGGTALRNVLTSLSGKKFAKTFGDLGVSAYDAEGNLRPLKDTFADLNDVMSGMSDEEKTKLITSVFNKADLKNVNALLGTSKDRWDELSDAIDNSAGAGKEMAETQLDNLQGDITLFKSALEGAQIAISDGLSPQLRDFVQFGSDGLSRLTEAFKEGGISGAVSVFGTILSDALQLIISKLPDFVNASVKLIGALGKGILDNLPMIVVAAASITEQLTDALIKGLPDLIDGAFHLVEGLAKAVSNMLPTLVPAVIELLTKIVDIVAENIPIIISIATTILTQLAQGILENLPMLLESVVQMMIAFSNSMVEMLPTLIPTIVELVLTIADALLNNLSPLIDASLAIILALADGIIAALPILIEKTPEIIDKLVQAISENLPKIVLAAWTIIIELGKALVKYSPELIKMVPNIIASLINGFGAYAGKMVEVGITLVGKIKEGISSFNPFEWGADMIQSFIDGVNSMIDKAVNAIKNFAKNIAKFIHFSEPDEGPLSNFHTYAPDMIDLFIKGVKDNTKKLQDQVASSFDFGEVGTVSIGDASVSMGNDIYSLLEQYLPNMANQQLMLDGKTLVGGTVSRMDEKMGTINQYAERGVIV